jgi:glutamate synthase (NADPH/NADH) small chain
MVFKAIGQTLESAEFGADFSEVELEGGRIRVDEHRKTSLPDVWAGGDCISDGDDLTVIAVEDGKIAAENINSFLKA